MRQWTPFGQETWPALWGARSWQGDFSAEPRHARRRVLPCSRLAGIAIALATFARPALAAAPLDLGGNARIELVEVPAGEFVQGGNPRDAHAGADEGQRKVHISRPFAVGKTLVTVGQFRRFVEVQGYRTEAEKGTSGGFGWDGKDLVQKPGFTWRSPGFVQTQDDPVVIITYNDALAFTSWASKVTGREVRLPTEAEWEWAIGAGAPGRFFWGENVAAATQYAWFFDNSGGGTKPVGKRPANTRGVLDAVGNAWQWCADYHGPIGEAMVEDPWQREPMTWAQSDKPRRVLKGGSWFTKDAWKLRTGARHRATEGSRNADFGFRVVVSSGASLAEHAAAESQSTGADPKDRTKAPRRAVDATSDGDAIAPWTPALVLGGGVGLMLLVLWGRRSKAGRNRVRAAGLGVTVCKDGFLVQGLRQRSIVTYRINRASGVPRRVSVEPNPVGAFIYTGETPSGVELLDVVPQLATAAAAARVMASSALRNEPSRAMRPSRSADRWPSAY